MIGNRYTPTPQQTDQPAQAHDENASKPETAKKRPASPRASADHLDQSEYSQKDLDRFERAKRGLSRLGEKEREQIRKDPKAWLEGNVRKGIRKTMGMETTSDETPEKKTEAKQTTEAESTFKEPKILGRIREGKARIWNLGSGKKSRGAGDCSTAGARGRNPIVSFFRSIGNFLKGGSAASEESAKNMTGWSEVAGESAACLDGIDVNS